MPANAAAWWPASACRTIADPQATSRAILALLRNPQRWQAAQAVGLQRVERYYTEALMLGRYRGLYREATEIA